MAINLTGASPFIDANLMPKEKEVSNTSSRKSGVAMNRDFMTMLMTQLKYQDPMNPMDNNQMTSQLAQLSQVNLLENINESIISLNNRENNKSLPLDLASLVDKNAHVSINPDDLISFFKNNSSQLDDFNFQINTLAPKEKITAIISNNQGEQLTTRTLSSDELGQSVISMNELLGKNWKNGLYNIQFKTNNAGFTLDILGKIKGVTLPKDGEEPMLDLAGITQIELNRINRIQS